MKPSLRFLVMISSFVLNSTGGSASPADHGKTESAVLHFSDVDYLHRWSKDDQHEFTPRDQADLDRWSDMVTLNYYKRVSDGDGLAATANAVLTTYQNNRAMVLRTDSVPRTPEKPAEHLIVVLFPRPDFIEAVFARFRLNGDVGMAVIYSHREYGAKVGNQMSAWLQQNGPATEKALMTWDRLPRPEQLKN